MSLTRAQYRTRIAQRMDATSSSRWDATPGTGGEIDPILSHVFDREWRTILTHAPSVRIGTRTPTSNASGRYALSDLNSGSGDTLQRLFRIRSVVIDDTPYVEVSPIDYTMAESLDLDLKVYWREMDSLVALPIQASKAADAIWVTHLPQRPDALTADSVTVTFPDGYEELLILESAGLLLAKGGSETQAAAELRALASEIRNDMLSDLSRFGPKPHFIRFDDAASDWAG